MGGAEAGRLSRGRGEGQGPADAARREVGGKRARRARPGHLMRLARRVRVLSRLHSPYLVRVGLERARKCGRRRAERRARARCKRASVGERPERPAVTPSLSLNPLSLSLSHHTR